MDHSLPSPRSAYSFDQSLYSPCQSVTKPLHEYDRIPNPPAYNPQQYNNPGSVGSLPPEDTVLSVEHYNRTPPLPPYLGNLPSQNGIIPSFTQLLEDDDHLEQMCKPQQVSNDTVTFATLGAVSSPLSTIRSVIHQRGDHVLPIEQFINIIPDRESNINIYASKGDGDFNEYGLDGTTLSPSQSENLDLALASIKAEAEGSQTPVIKDELRYQINRKRSLSALGDVTFTDEEVKKAKGVRSALLLEYLHGHKCPCDPN